MLSHVGWLFDFHSLRGSYRGDMALLQTPFISTFLRFSFTLKPRKGSQFTLQFGEIEFNAEVLEQAFVSLYMYTAIAIFVFFAFACGSLWPRFFCEGGQVGRHEISF